MRNILVTGGAGFVGSHVCEQLLQEGHAVTCLDNFSTGSREKVQHLDGLEIIDADVNIVATWKSLKKRRFDSVYHYAATVGVLRTEENPSHVLQDVDGIQHVAAFARAGNAKAVVFASSSEVYGEPKRVPEKEEDGVVGWNPYSTVKLYGEYLFKSLWQEHKIPAVSLRFFNVYGPRQEGNSYGFVTAHFIEQVLAGKSPTVFGDGSQTRDFVYVGDNVRIALRALDREEAYGEAINIGTGQETSVLTLAKAVIGAAGKDDDIIPEFLPARSVDIKRRCADTTKLQSVIGLSCDTSLQDGLRVTIDSLQAVTAAHTTEKSFSKKHHTITHPATA